MSHLEAILDAYSGVVADETRAAILSSLLQREDYMADLIRAAGMQFGLFPEIVAKVIQDVGLGSPKTPEEQEYINAQFAGLMQRLREEHLRQQGEGDQT